ncbi:hypothetical protein PHMEG_0002672 [Phytophthora megakarya]|uniref:Uncharacterized protein n=1 Tax=Phytophthora megakarya TaxID=4795 RepID=A0A225WXV0_9STRA|nr:hypothetical protein PHMEG_0002672 [Phytophthora megakarya]
MLKVSADIKDNDSGEDPLTSPEYSPRKHASKHFEELDSMNPGDAEIRNVLPAFGLSTAFETWEEFEEMFSKYKNNNKLKFRVRRSVKTSLYNRYD